MDAVETPRRLPARERGQLEAQILPEGIRSERRLLRPVVGHPLPVHLRDEPAAGPRCPSLGCQYIQLFLHLEFPERRHRPGRIRRAGAQHRPAAGGHVAGRLPRPLELLHVQVGERLRQVHPGDAEPRKGNHLVRGDLAGGCRTRPPLPLRCRRRQRLRRHPLLLGAGYRMVLRLELFGAVGNGLHLHADEARHGRCPRHDHRRIRRHGGVRQGRPNPQGSLHCRELLRNMVGR